MNFDYISVKDAAMKLNLTERWIQQLCKDGKVEGAMRFGAQKTWLVPNKWVEERMAQETSAEK